MKRCCRTCVFCDVEKRECDEGGYTEIGDLDRELTEEDCNAWEAREDGYTEAESILDDWDYRSLPDGERVIWAIGKAKQAIRDCLEMGLNGIGE